MATIATPGAALTAVDSSAAVAAPSTPDTTPSVSTGAESTAAPSTPETSAGASVSAGEQPRINPGEAPGAFLKRFADWKDKQGSGATAEGAAAAAAAGEAAPGQAAQEPDKGKDNVGGEAGAEQKPEPAGEQKAEPEAGEAEPDAGKEAAEMLLGKGPLPPKDLAAKLKENPALAAELDKSGLKDSIFAASRLASQVADYKERFPDIETADFVLNQANSFGDLQELLSAAVDVDSTRPLINKMVELSYRRDANGELLKNEQGQPISDGSVGRMVDNMNRMALDWYAAEAEKSGDDEVLAAVKILQARMGDAAPQEEEMTEAQKQREAEIAAKEDSLHRQEQEALTRQHNEFESRVATSIDDQVTKLVTSLVDGTPISEFNKKAAIAQVRAAVLAKVKNDNSFRHQRDDLMRRGYASEVEQKRVGLAISRVKAHLYKAAEPILREAGALTVQSQKTVADKVAAQVTTAKSDTRGGSRPVSTPEKQSTEQAIGQFRSDYVAKNGRTPSEAEIFAFIGGR